MCWINNVLECLVRPVLYGIESTDTSSEYVEEVVIRVLSVTCQTPAM